ncbi:MAG: hypothetical protein H6R27_1318 [Proteobacteria bacterium]|nr:hypothetical protein [Pseudomonadota bacterium]
MGRRFGNRRPVRAGRVGRLRNAIALAALVIAAGAMPREPAWSAPAACPPASGFGLLCGQTRPEDLARIPGTRWVIASGFSAGAGLKLVDTAGRSLRPAYRGTSAEVGRPADAFPHCQTAPDPELFNAQGLSLRAAGEGRYRLYVVNHGGRESVEVFDVDARPDVPTLAWRGCVLLPAALAANSVASYSDGTLLVTVLVHPGDTFADFVEGRNTGGVYQWRPGTAGFERVPGTELPGNNGIETAADDSGFFVVAFGRHAILRYSRHDPAAPPVQSVAPGFMPDNVHWDGGKLITAGMMYDEPACGGTRKVIDGRADDMRCHRGTVVAELDPQLMTFRIVAYAPPDPTFNGASAAVLVGGELWLGSYQSDCLAYRSLPWLNE